MKTFLILQIPIAVAYTVACYAGASVWVMFAVFAVDVLSFIQGRNSMR